jgi:peroxiredoxin
MENAPPRVGEMAPDFELMNQNKEKVELSDFRGRKKVVLLFYPMDFSPTCADEHCKFSTEVPRIIGNEDAVIFGINCDSPYCHAAFKKQYNISYDLLSDTSRDVVKKYGMFAGVEPFNCSKRGTVVIGKDGRITHYHEQPMREARKVEDIAKAVSI